MISSMELEIPRLARQYYQNGTLVFIVLEALSIPLYEPLQEVSLKHLTYSLLTMASARRLSELQALVFDPECIQIKPKGVGITLYLTLSSCVRIRSLARLMTPGTFQSDLGAPTCRCCLLIPIKDNNAGKELSAATISRGICDTIVNSHVTLGKSKSLPKKAKAQELPAILNYSIIFYRS